MGTCVREGKMAGGELREKGKKEKSSFDVLADNPGLLFGLATY